MERAQQGQKIDTTRLCLLPPGQGFRIRRTRLSDASSLRRGAIADDGSRRAQKVYDPGQDVRPKIGSAVCQEGVMLRWCALLVVRDDEERSIRRFIDVRNDTDGAVPEGGGSLGLVDKSFLRVRVASELGREEFQGNSASEVQILGILDDTHASSPSFS
jgi:hypothetical protein